MKLSLFRNRSFTLLILGMFVSNIGTLVQQFAISLYVLNRTGSGLAFASVIAISVIPQLLLGPFVGVFVDKMNRKHIVVISDFISFAVVALTAVYFYFTETPSLSYLYLLTVILSLINMLFQPANATMIPSLIEKENLLAANSIKSFAMSFSSIVSPLMAGFFFSAYGLLLVLVMNAASFFISGISGMFIDLPSDSVSQSSKEHGSFKKEFLKGLSFLRTEHLLLQILIASAIANFALSALVMVTLPYAVKRILYCSDSQFGFYSSAMMLGLLISPILISKYFKKMSMAHIVDRTMLMMGVLILFMSVDISPIFIHLFAAKDIPFYILTFLSVVFFVVIGIHNISVATVFQTKVPKEMLGRISTLFTTITLIAAPLGQLIFGFLLDHGVKAASLVIIAAITLAAKMQFSIRVQKPGVCITQVNSSE